MESRLKLDIPRNVALAYGRGTYGLVDVEVGIGLLSPLRGMMGRALSEPSAPSLPLFLDDQGGLLNPKDWTFGPLPITGAGATLDPPQVAAELAAYLTKHEGAVLKEIAAITARPGRYLEVHETFQKMLRERPYNKNLVRSLDAGGGYGVINIIRALREVCDPRAVAAVGAVIAAAKRKNAFLINKVAKEIAGNAKDYYLAGSLNKKGLLCTHPLVSAALASQGL